jgi:hypothetical protein
MKKIGLFLLPAIIFLASCSKEGIQQPPINESEWLRKERGIAMASNFQCDFFVAETARGYAVMRTWGGFPPLRGALLYGDYNRFGVQTFYNRTEGYLMNADIRDFTPSYFMAMDQLNWYCSQFDGAFGNAATDSTHLKN